MNQQVERNNGLKVSNDEGISGSSTINKLDTYNLTHKKY